MVTGILIALLFVNAAFTVLVWPRFFARIAKDPRARDENGRATRFLVVHATLIGVAIAIAVASVVAAIAALVTGT